ncbi:hypothetical protein E2R51_13975 [Jeotgalibacillus sp. S-D1]|uniref:hypothetical protein n=1 Tax=Jeotgalibacillus sp. S-D1 TaxID=2552189 RepID=UPI001059FB0A|nr:hypothetical protein [Jeotgalibacillus sp. S-D1]TDL31468.1 hypothetical protein E2R51_13975 [Jeotgalibacillus sp. S-D1]
MVVIWLLILLVLFLFIKSRPGISKRRISGNNILKLFLGYMAVLLIATVAFYIFPFAEVPDNEIGEQSHEPLSKQGAELYNLSTQGDFDKIDPAFLKSTQEISYNKNEITIVETLTEQSAFQIVVEKKESDDGMIELRYYESPYRLMNVNISDQISKIKTEIIEDNLLINSDGRPELSYSTISKPMILSQFQGDREDKMFNEINYTEGTRVLHVKVPGNVEVTNEKNEFIHFLD